MQSNIFLLNLDFDKFQIERTPFSEEKLHELRANHNETHSFFRNGDYIYISNKEDETDLSLGESVELSFDKNERIVNSLIKHLFFRTFKDRFPHIKPIRFSPFMFYSRKERDDLVYSYLPNELKNVLSYRKHIEVQLRKFNLNGKSQWGFVINTSHKWLLDINCYDLHSKGMDIVGLDVLQTEELPGLSNIMAPNEEFIGSIQSIEGDYAEVATSDGIEKLQLTELYLKKTTYNIRAFLESMLNSDKSEQILSNVRIDEQKRLDPEKEYQEINSIAKLLFTSQDNNEINTVIFQNRDGFYFSVSNIPFSPGNTFKLQSPNFIFDPAATQVESKYPDLGLKNFGPYDSNIFDPKSPRIVGICHKSNRGKFTNFLHRLINGIPDSKWFKEGFRKKYDFHEVNLEVNDVSDYSIQEYDKIISSLTEKPDIVIIEIPERFKKLKPELNPYYKLKAKLLTLEIPVQFVQNKNLSIRNGDAILNAIGLQMYAKLGGTPWVLPSARSVDRELIIGIGHSIIRNSEYKGAEQNRVVGITTFFSSDGQYLLSNKAKDVHFDNYFQELLKNLNEALNTLQENQAWKENDTIRLIFHIFKPIKNIEHDVVQELIKSFSRYKIQYAFVTISKKHPFQLFDTSQAGKKSYYGSGVIGKYVPYRASNVLIDESACLVQLLGVNEIKTAKHGSSNPILIRIRKPLNEYGQELESEELFTDIQYIVQQIYSLTYLSWRGFLPSEQPATMLYSNLFSNLLGKLRKIEGWHPDILNFKLKRKKWFL
jgi:hypothetical protein